MKRQLEQLTRDNARLASENKRLSDSLSTSQGENKTLSSKLAAARSSAQQETKNVPGSAVKPRTTGVVLPGTVEAAKEAQLAKQKVDLYSDLTNLVILSVKKNEDDEDVHDCLQTGRNGSEYTLALPQIIRLKDAPIADFLQPFISISQLRKAVRLIQIPSLCINPYWMTNETKSSWICCLIILQRKSAFPEARQQNFMVEWSSQCPKRSFWKMDKPQCF